MYGYTKEQEREMMKETMKNFSKKGGTIEVQKSQKSPTTLSYRSKSKSR